MASEIDLKTQLPVLYALQEIDERLNRLNDQRRKLHRHAQQLQAQLDKEKQTLDAKKEAYTAVQVEQRRKNSELQVLQERLNKYAEQLKNSRDANEYTALTSQIARSTEQASAFEEDIIGVLLKIDDAKAAVEEETAHLAAVEETAQRERKRIAVTLKRLEAEHQKATTARNAQVVEVHPTLLKEYDRWRQRRGTTLVAKLVGEVCDGCKVSMPPQKSLEVRQLKQAYYCSSCHRLLYPVDDSASAEPPADS